jgi:hypothetical protein
MKSNFRIIETDKGFLPQEKIEKRDFWGNKYDIWQCCSFYTGTKEPFYFKTFDGAMDVLIRDIKFKIIEESYK